LPAPTTVATMHSPHTITLALADARVADLQRAATHGTATVAPRRHRRHLRGLTLLGLAATAALAAFAPTGALARTPHDVAAAPQDLRAAAKTSSLAGTPARQEMRSSDARDAAAGRGTYNSPDVVIVKVPRSSQAAAPEPSSAGGIDWADAGIGAGSLLGLSLIGLGAGLVIVHRRRAAHGAPPIAGATVSLPPLTAAAGPRAKRARELARHDSHCADRPLRLPERPLTPSRAPPYDRAQGGRRA
jgi:hypothetical protein